MLTALDLAGRGSKWLRPVPVKPEEGYSAEKGGNGIPVKNPALLDEGRSTLLIVQRDWLETTIPELVCRPFVSIATTFQTLHQEGAQTSRWRLTPDLEHAEPAPASMPPADQDMSDPAPSQSPQESRGRWFTTPEVLDFFRSDENPSGT